MPVSRRNKRRASDTQPDISGLLSGFGFNPTTEVLNPDDKEGLNVGFLDRAGKNLSAVSPAGTRQRIPAAGGGGNLANLSTLVGALGAAGGGGSAAGAAPGPGNAMGSERSVAGGAGPALQAGLAALARPADPSAVPLAQTFTQPAASELGTLALPTSKDLRSSGTVPPQNDGFLSHAVEFLGSPQAADIFGRLAQAIAGPYQDSWQAQVGKLGSELASEKRAGNFVKRLASGQTLDDINFSDSDIAGITPDEINAALNQYTAIRQDSRAQKQLELEISQDERARQTWELEFGKGEIEYKEWLAAAETRGILADVARDKANIEKYVIQRYGRQIADDKAELSRLGVLAEQAQIDYYTAAADRQTAEAGAVNATNTTAYRAYSATNTALNYAANAYNRASGDIRELENDINSTLGRISYLEKEGDQFGALPGLRTMLEQQQGAMVLAKSERDRIGAQWNAYGSALAQILPDIGVDVDPDLFGVRPPPGPEAAGPPNPSTTLLEILSGFEQDLVGATAGRETPAPGTTATPPPAAPAQDTTAAPAPAESAPAPSADTTTTRAAPPVEENQPAPNISDVRAHALGVVVGAINRSDISSTSSTSVRMTSLLNAIKNEDDRLAKRLIGLLLRDSDVDFTDTERNSLSAFREGL